MALKVSRGLGAAGGEEHVGGEAGDQADPYAPVEQGSVAAPQGDGHQLDDHVEDGASGQSEENQAHRLAGELVADQGSQHGGATTDRTEEKQKSPTGLLLLGGQRGYDAESFGRIVQGEAGHQQGGQ